MWMHACYFVKYSELSFIWLQVNVAMSILVIVWKVSKYGVFSGPYFPVFSPYAGKYGSEKTAYLNTFHVVGWFFNYKKLVAVLPIVTLWNSDKHVVVENVYHVT